MKASISFIAALLLGFGIGCTTSSEGEQEQAELSSGEGKAKPAGDLNAGSQEQVEVETAEVKEKSPDQSQGSQAQFVQAWSLKVRNAPSMDAPVINYLSRGAKVEAQSVQGGWVQIGEQQFVSSKYLGPAIPSSMKSNK